jgi:hypothetical protein
MLHELYSKTPLLIVSGNVSVHTPPPLAENFEIGAPKRTLYRAPTYLNPALSVYNTDEHSMPISVYSDDDDDNDDDVEDVM